MQSIENRIVARIQGKARGICFTPKAFLDLGSPEAVRVALHRLEKRGTVIQALRHIGARKIDRNHIAHLRQTMPASDKARLKRDRIYAPGWMHRIIDAIAEDSHA